MKKRVFMLLCTTIIIGMSMQPVLAGKKTLSEEDLGIRHEDIDDESRIKPATGDYPKDEPGKSKKIERAFENSPPLIPHDITGMLPIAETNNMCIGCHMPESARATGATPIPKSHLVDFQTGKDLKGKLDGKRYDCMQCHVQQVTLTPPVANLFKGEFRSKEGRRRSNLIDTLNEGVKAE